MASFQKTPTEYEAGDLIKGLSKHLPEFGGEASEDQQTLCVIHTRALIFLIRHADLSSSWPNILRQLIKSSPITAIAIAICWVCYIFAKVKGII